MKWACGGGATKLYLWLKLCNNEGLVWFRGLTPQQQPGSYQGGEMMMKSGFWWRKPEHPEETTDLRQVTDETFSHIRPLPSPGIELGPQRCEAK